jgi:hypothetical protein
LRRLSKDGNTASGADGPEASDQIFARDTVRVVLGRIESDGEIARSDIKQVLKQKKVNRSRIRKTAEAEFHRKANK